MDLLGGFRSAEGLEEDGNGSSVEAMQSENQTHAPQDRCYLFRKFKLVEEAPNTLVLPKKASATDAPKT